MYNGLLHAHSGLRWLILLLLVLSIIKAFVGWFGNKEFTSGDKKLFLFAMMFCHIQLLIGLLLYFISPTIEVAMNDMAAAMKDKTLRFWAVEHISMMLVSLILITVGYSTAKRATDSKTKFKRTAIFYTLGLLLILASIPWPFSSVARGWF